MYKGTYLWPPRPENPVPSEMLDTYDGYIAQIKKNGQCEIIIISPDREIKVMNRHNENHKNWNPVKNEFDFFKAIPGKEWIVFVAELLHAKVKNGDRNTHYVHDVIVHGKQLIGKTTEQRQNILRELIVPSKIETHSHYVIHDNVWLAKNYENGFETLFNSLSNVEDEGLVLKRKNGTLKMCNKASANSGWQFKCRKPHKNYSF